MNTFKKNQIIITALAIMIAIAGYLNFTGRGNPKEDEDVFNNESTTANELVTMADATNTDTGVLVPNDEATINTSVIPNEMEIVEEVTATEPGEIQEVISVDEANAALDVADPDLEEVTSDDVVGEAIFTSSNSVEQSYFLEKKIEREQKRSQSISALNEIIDSDSIAEEQRVQAVTQLMSVQGWSDKEFAAESLLEAKGFKDVFVLMDETSAQVVLNAAAITEVDLAQILQVVSEKTGVDPTAITIIPLNVQE